MILVCLYINPNSIFGIYSIVLFLELRHPCSEPRPTRHDSINCTFRANKTHSQLIPTVVCHATMVQCIAMYTDLGCNHSLRLLRPMMQRHDVMR